MHTSRTTRNTLVFGQIRNVRGIRVGIAGLNSAWSAGEENQKGSLWLGGHWRIQHVRPEFEDTRFNIALMHHAPGWFTDSETPALEQELPEHFHFLLHGHEHWDRVTPMDVHTHIHTRIAAGACYGSSTQESGYNIVRLNPDKGTGEVWLREYDERGGVWVSKIVHGRTGGEPKGVWRLAVNCSRKDG